MSSNICSSKNYPSNICTLNNLTPEFVLQNYHFDVINSSLKFDLNFGVLKFGQTFELLNLKFKFKANKLRILKKERAKRT